ncbi:MAG: hypothetical protein SPJ86_06390, partial [Eubacteriales bacterium]|nr:hypothetical protein [Eubacteriales bacterium]
LTPAEPPIWAALQNYLDMNTIFTIRSKTIQRAWLQVQGNLRTSSISMNTDSLHKGFAEKMMTGNNTKVHAITKFS